MIMDEKFPKNTFVDIFFAITNIFVIKFLIFAPCNPKINQ